jgi:hypothetical protein
MSDKDKSDKPKADKSNKGTTAEISEGQPNLDVDALMDVVNEHQKAATPADVKPSGAKDVTATSSEPAATPDTSKQQNPKSSASSGS